MKIGKALNLYIKMLQADQREVILLGIYNTIIFGKEQVFLFIRNLIKKSRLFISTYNATTYLESMAWNVPTIIFWDENCWELKEEAKPYFELLKSVGIFHNSPESAAKHMTNIWDNVDDW